MIKVEGVYFGYSNNPVINNITFTLNKYECLGLIGKNGAGKSSLLKLLSGLQKPDRGRILVDEPIVSLIELGMHFSPDLSVVKNIKRYALLSGLSFKSMAAYVNSVLEFVDLSHADLNKKFAHLSTGLKARVSFGSSIMLPGGCYIIDEVLSVGDIYFQKKCLNKIAELRGNGSSFIIVSHSLSLINEFCSRCLWIEGGQIKMDGSPKIVTEKFEEFILDLENEKKQLPDIEYHSKSLDLRDINGYGTMEAIFSDLEVVINQSEQQLTISGKVISKSSQPLKISLGFMIKNLNGVQLSGGSTLDSPCHFGSNEEKSFEIQIDHRLNYGTYFTNISLTKGTFEDYIYIHRIIDVFSFEVKRTPKKFSGHFSSNHNHTWSK